MNTEEKILYKFQTIEKITNLTAKHVHIFIMLNIYIQFSINIIIIHYK